MTCRRQCLPQCSLCPDFRYFRNEIVINVRITFGDRDLNNYYDRNHLHESDIVRLVECGVHPYCEWLLETSISLWIRVGSEHIVNGNQRLSILFTVFVSFVRQLSEARNRRSESMPSWKEPIFFLWRKSKKSSSNTHKIGIGRAVTQGELVVHRKARAVGTHPRCVYSCNSMYKGACVQWTLFTSYLRWWRSRKPKVFTSKRDLISVALHTLTAIAASSQANAVTIKSCCSIHIYYYYY